MPLTLNCPNCKASLHVRSEYAGKQMQCPRCSATVAVPAAETLAADIKAVAPASSASSAEPTRPCPRCKKPILLAARKCRYCQAWLDDREGDEDEDWPERARPSFKACPRCQASGAERVVWTFWGSFYGPALFSHVRCPQCGYGYNGKTGRSNLVPAIVMVAVPAIGIIAVVGALALWVWSQSNRL